MKAVLVQPPGNYVLRGPPLALGYLTAVLNRSGFDVSVFDLNVEPLALEKRLPLERPSVVGVSCAIGNVRQAFEIVCEVKSLFPLCFVVLGGAYPSLMGERLLGRHGEVDAGVVGEGELTIVELLDQLQNEQSLSNVDGLVFRDGDTVKRNRPREPIAVLDDLPFPARERLPMMLYGENAGALFTSRGCPYQCIFCSRSVFGKRWRGHSPEYVLAEIEQIIKSYEVRRLNFLDDNFAFDVQRAEEILDGIIAKRWGLSLYFWNGLRVDSLTKQILLKMKKAGCTAINYGVESTNPEVLARIKKGITLDQVEMATKQTHEAGIKANAFLMIGNPGDTSSIVEEVRDFVENVKVDGVHVSMATPLPGTELWSWVEKNGRWLAYDHNELLDWPIDDMETAYPVFETDDFSSEERVVAYRRIRNLLLKKRLLL